MFWRMIISVPFFWCAVAHALPLASFPPPGMTLPKQSGEEHVWWDGRASFKGQVIAPACTLAMKDAWQQIDMGTTPLRDLQNSPAGPEKKFRLRRQTLEIETTRMHIVCINSEISECSPLRIALCSILPCEPLLAESLLTQPRVCYCWINQRTLFIQQNWMHKSVGMNFSLLGLLMFSMVSSNELIISRAAFDVSLQFYI